MTQPKIVKCPRCAKTVEWSDKEIWRPFCSERCKLIDLGSWASEAYRIPEKQPASAEDSSEQQDEQQS